MPKKGRKKKKARPGRETQRRPRVFHVDVGEIFFIGRNSRGNLAVFGHNPSTGGFDREVVELQRKDSLLLDLHNCVGIIARNKKTGRIGIAHTTGDFTNPEIQKLAVDFSRDPENARTVAREMANQGFEKAAIGIASGLVDKSHDIMTRPGFFGSKAAQHITREMGKDIEVELVGGESTEKGRKSGLHKIVEEEFEKSSITARHNPNHIGGDKRRYLLIKPAGKNLAEIDIEGIRFLISERELEQLMREAKSINRPAWFGFGK